MNFKDLQNMFSAIGDFIWHPMAFKYHRSDSNTRLIIKGNQGGGTATAMMDLALRILGIHPNKRRNRFNKPIRCVSKVVPKDHDDEENQQFVEFRRLIPPELWVKKLTARSKVGHIRRMCGGPDAKIEFMASTQDLDAFMSVQRSAYYQDEEIERVKWDENMMRLSKAASDDMGGDLTLSMTPVKGLDWSYDSLWKRATRIYRSKIIQDKFGLPAVEEHNNDNDIEIFSWSTYDNPAMTKDGVKNITKDIDDEDELAMRVYGVFRQVSGRIYKVFDERYHVIPFEKFFDASLFRNYWHYRIIDFHPTKPWYITWVAVSPTHEWFVWNELKATHDRTTSFELRDIIKSESLLGEDEEYNRRTYIDPLACVSQNNTNRSVKDDISSGDEGLRRVESADTKNNNGRVNVKTRLKNALSCGVPGNNLDTKSPPDIRFGSYRPTLWFFDNCEEHIEHFRSWRLVDFKQAHVRATRTSKKESEKWSDYCRNLEFLGAANPVFYERRKQDNVPRLTSLFQGRERRYA
jgi:hypothetical protein